LLWKKETGLPFTRGAIQGPPTHDFIQFMNLSEKPNFFKITKRKERLTYQKHWPCPFDDHSFLFSAPVGMNCLLNHDDVVEYLSFLNKSTLVSINYSWEDLLESVGNDFG
jgi:hypothetical protein